MNQKAFRVDPQMPVGDMQTYQITAPVATHFRPASCQEIGCKNFQNGWVTILPVNSDHVEMVRSLKGKYHFTEKTAGDGLIEFTFPAGQTCFRQSQHRVSLERDANFIVKGGDWRGNPTGMHRAHVNADDWVEDFAEHQDTLNNAING